MTYFFKFKVHIHFPFWQDRLKYIPYKEVRIINKSPTFFKFNLLFQSI